ALALMRALALAQPMIGVRPSVVKTNSLPLICGKASRMAQACDDSGTSCSLWFLERDAGSRHKRRFSSISSHVIAPAPLRRQPVKIIRRSGTPKAPLAFAGAPQHA